MIQSSDRGGTVAMVALVALLAVSAAQCTAAQVQTAERVGVRVAEVGCKLLAIFDVAGGVAGTLCDDIAQEVESDIAAELLPSSATIGYRAHKRCRLVPLGVEGRDSGERICEKHLHHAHAALARRGYAVFPSAALPMKDGGR